MSEIAQANSRAAAPEPIAQAASADDHESAPAASFSCNAMVELAGNQVMVQGIAGSAEDAKQQAALDLLHRYSPAEKLYCAA